MARYAGRRGETADDLAIQTLLEDEGVDLAAVLGFAEHFIWTAIGPR
jgi:hypothetical protein